MRVLVIVGLLVGIAGASVAGQPPVTPGLPQPDFIGQIDPKWALTQGGLLLTLLVVLWSYRRDFFRKADAQQADLDRERETRRLEVQREREEKADLKAVLREVAASNQAHAISVQRNTDAMNDNTKATERLATHVAFLTNRRSGDIP